MIYLSEIDSDDGTFVVVVWLGFFLNVILFLENYLNICDRRASRAALIHSELCGVGHVPSDWTRVALFVYQL